MRVITNFLLLMCLGACFLKKNISHPPKPQLTAQDSICLEMEDIVKNNWKYDSVSKSYVVEKGFWVLATNTAKYKDCFELGDTNYLKKVFGEPSQRNSKLQLFLYGLFPPCKDLCDECNFVVIGYKKGLPLGIGQSVYQGNCN